MAEKKDDSKTPVKTVKVKFLKTPTGRFKLAYNKGDEAKIPEKQAAELIKAEYAEKG